MSADDLERQRAAGRAAFERQGRAEQTEQPETFRRELDRYLVSRAWHRRRGLPLPPMPRRVDRAYAVLAAILGGGSIVALGLMFGHVIANW